jgi:hypothetical protein
MAVEVSHFVSFRLTASALMHYEFAQHPLHGRAPPIRIR